MRKKLVAFLLVALIIISGCSTSSKEQTQASNSQQEQKKENVINMMEINEISSMDPGNALDGGSFIAITQVFEGLYNLDADDKIIPGVATELPDISEDGLTYTVNLRDNAYWSNEEKVTAHDFVYAWQRVVDPEFASPSSFLLTDIKNASAILAGTLDKSELGVQAVNDYQLEITLEQPVAYFTSVLTFPTLFPQNQAFVEAQKEQYGIDSSHLIYNGPFVLTDWTHSNQTWTYQKNELYWNKQQTNLDKVTIQVIKDTSLAVKLFEAGELDRGVLSGEYARQYKEDDAYTTQLDSWVHTIELNQTKDDTKTFFSDVNARKAVGMAIDRKHITQELLGNDSQAIYGLIPAEFVENPETGVDFREENGAVQTYDPEMAQTYWQKALKESGQTELTVSLLASDQDENKTITEYLKYVLEETLPGLTVEISLLPENNLLTRKQDHEYDLLLTRQGPDFQDPTTFLNTYQSEAFNNPSNYKSQSYDDALALAKSLSAEPTERWQVLLEAETILLDDYGVIPVYQSANSALLRETIHGMIHHLFGPPNYYGKIQLDN